VFVCGLAGIIVTSIVNNNNGLVLALGGSIAFAAVALLTHSAVTAHDRIDAFVEADAELLEHRIAELVAAGADESAVRELVRHAMRLERS
jgi:hypothetical protein